MELLQIDNLKTHFELLDKTVYAVNGISFIIDKGEVVALIGESGSGKSVTSLSIMGLIPKETGRIKSGEIIYKGQDLLKKREDEMRKFRGKEISMIYQEPMNALNPRLKIGYQIQEVLMIHSDIDKKEAKKKTIEMLGKVEIPEPEKLYNYYPHQLSGGMRQRVMIAMALISNPELLIADEPTTALDVTIQAEILELIKRLKNEMNMSVLLITHDLGVVADTADKIVVMYSGKIMEIAPAKELYINPLHPYTQGLLKCIPRMNQGKERLFTINGYVPDLSFEPEGCEFYDRCQKRKDICKNTKPKLVKINDEHFVYCLLNEEAGE